jgi:hypothetical protein
MRGKIAKQTASYVFMHGGRTEYECRDCSQFIPEKDRCIQHGPQDVIRAHGSCDYFLYGKPQPGAVANGPLTPKSSGYIENPAKVGFSCKRCEYFDLPADCRKVDKNSPGPTPGLIHPNGCCNAWEADEERSRLATAKLGELLRRRHATAIFDRQEKQP